MSSYNMTRALVPSGFGISGREMEELFDRLFHPGSSPAANRWTPPASVWETGEQIHLEMELAGVAREDIDVSFEDGLLKISAKRPQPDTTDRSYLHDERAWGEMTRTMRVADSVDPDSIEASFQKGLLHIQLCKRAEVLPKRIEIKTS
ncbi:Hsp20/alpha crystallin family protein [Rosistilla oblonga]|uniref:Spore protein SP21 n=1 Tax=Rosistilla oblonga TaxID=2527990 RepID=A0A518J1U4_9BACT|nr:Hsp20/alpha crystallin family protein [Rosistilla oblonga]QDV59310.1 Spore protein SP21 [Rosistilla oblonga]